MLEELAVVIFQYRAEEAFVLTVTLPVLFVFVVVTRFHEHEEQDFEYRLTLAPDQERNLSQVGVYRVAVPRTVT